MKFVNYKNKRGQKGSEYYKAVNDGIRKFIEEYEKPKNATVEITEDEPRNAGVDVECCYLCHGIWARIMGNKYYGEGKCGSSNLFNWCKNNNADNCSIIFHLDIMHNPKIDEKNNKSSCGIAKDVNKEKRKEWEEIYHSIGNMSPIPWFETIGGNNINLQSLHSALDERWDLFLKVLKDNWNVWYREEDRIMTFEEYMIITCQHVYYEGVLEELKKNQNYLNENDLNKCEEEIKSGKKELISFDKMAKDEIADKIADKIIDLITVRGRIIIEKLKKDN